MYTFVIVFILTAHDKTVDSDAVDGHSRRRRRRWRPRSTPVAHGLLLIEHPLILPAALRIFVRQIVHVVVLARKVLVQVVGARVEAGAVEAHGQRVARRTGELSLRSGRQRNVGRCHGHRRRPFALSATRAVAARRSVLFCAGRRPDPRSAFPKRIPK